MNDDVDIPVGTDINEEEEEEEEEETGDASQEAASGDSSQEQKQENSQQLKDDVKQEAEDTKAKEEDKGSLENSVPLCLSLYYTAVVYNCSRRDTTWLIRSRVTADDGDGVVIDTVGEVDDDEFAASVETHRDDADTKAAGDEKEEKR